MYIFYLHRLTAFVVKSFHQAKHHIYISQGVLDRAISFITNNQNYDGSFKTIGSVHDTMLKVEFICSYNVRFHLSLGYTKSKKRRHRN